MIKGKKNNVSNVLTHLTSLRIPEYPLNVLFRVNTENSLFLCPCFVNTALSGKTNPFVLDF